MTFTSTVLKKYVFGNRRVHVGSWDSAGVTGGDIDTKLKRVEYATIVHKGTAVTTATAVINETFPLASGSVTVVATAGDAGYWLAIGLRG